MSRVLKAPSVTAGRIVKDSGRIWLRNFVPFTLLYGLICLPTLFFYLGVDHGAFRNRYVNAAHLALANLVVGAVAYGVLMEMRGQRVGIGASMRTGLRRLVPVLGVGLVVAVVVGLGASFAYGVPGAVLQCVLFVAIPVAIFEKTSLVGALRRSHELTRDYKLTIVGVMLVILVASVVAGGLASVAFRHGRAWTPELMQAAQIIMSMAAMLTGAWHAVAAVVTYHHLREFKDGVGMEELAKVFE